MHTGNDKRTLEANERVRGEGTLVVSKRNPLRQRLKTSKLDIHAALAKCSRNARAHPGYPAHIGTTVTEIHTAKRQRMQEQQENTHPD